MVSRMGAPPEMEEKLKRINEFAKKLLPADTFFAIQVVTQDWFIMHSNLHRDGWVPVLREIADKIEAAKTRGDF